MRKEPFYFGLVLVSVGIILVLSSTSLQNVEVPVMVADESDKFQATAFLESKDNISISIYPNLDWLKFLDVETDVIPYYHKYVIVNITDPIGNISTVVFIFIKVPEQEVITIYTIEVRHFDGIIADENQEPPFKGMVEYAGNYTIDILPYFPPGGSAPVRIYVEKKGIRTTYPYTSLLPVGTATSILGSVVAVWSAKISKHKRITRVKGM